MSSRIPALTTRYRLWEARTDPEGIPFWFSSLKPKHFDWSLRQGFGSLPVSLSPPSSSSSSSDCILDRNKIFLLDSQITLFLLGDMSFESFFPLCEAVLKEEKGRFSRQYSQSYFVPSQFLVLHCVCFAQAHIGFAESGAVPCVTCSQGGRGGTASAAETGRGKRSSQEKKGRRGGKTLIYSSFLNRLYSRCPPSLHALKDWWDKSNVTWFFRGQTSENNCQWKKSRLSLFILDNRKWRPFHLKDDNVKIWVEVSIVTSLCAVAIVDVLMANSNDVNRAKTRYVGFAWPWNRRLVLIE